MFHVSAFTMPTQYGAIITGTGSALPVRRLTNADLAKMVDTNDQWITARTGSKERRGGQAAQGYQGAAGRRRRRDDRDAGDGCGAEGARHGRRRGEGRRPGH